MTTKLLCLIAVLFLSGCSEPPSEPPLDVQAPQALQQVRGYIYRDHDGVYYRWQPLATQCMDGKLYEWSKYKNWMNLLWDGTIDGIDSPIRCTP